ncbi:hypothetical protein BHE74_00042357 [Ensete ventricosum]|nr:hypothetical protein BHE74_00042357 [Ensete ventricosum]
MTLWSQTCSVDDDEYPSIEKRNGEIEADANKVDALTVSTTVEVTKATEPSEDPRPNKATENRVDEVVALEFTNAYHVDGLLLSGLASSAFGITHLISDPRHSSKQTSHRELLRHPAEAESLSRLHDQAPGSGCPLGFSTWAYRPPPSPSH